MGKWLPAERASLRIRYLGRFFLEKRRHCQKDWAEKTPNVNLGERVEIVEIVCYFKKKRKEKTDDA